MGEGSQITILAFIGQDRWRDWKLAASSFPHANNICFRQFRKFESSSNWLLIIQRLAS